MSGVNKWLGFVRGNAWFIYWIMNPEFDKMPRLYEIIVAKPLREWGFYIKEISAIFIINPSRQHLRHYIAGG